MFLAFGDSHRSKSALEKIAEIILREDPRFFVHTGDNYNDFQWLIKKTKVQGYGVRGNCDFGIIVGAQEELILEYEDKRIFLVHGHNYGVKFSLKSLLERARELNVDAVIFGHSHVQLVQEEDGVLLINPGSIPLPRGGSKPGYAKLHFLNGQLKAELVNKS